MTLLEIQKAAEGLPIEEKMDLMIFLLRSLHGHQAETRQSEYTTNIAQIRKPLLLI
jgi:hypothetical protein